MKRRAPKGKSKKSLVPAEVTGRYEPVLNRVLKAAQAKDYAGYSKFDALNSPFLHALTLNNKWLRLIITQAVKECPFHVRPLLGVQTSRNPKGIALFARAWLSLAALRNDDSAATEATTLLDWLLAHPSPGTANLSWGYNFIWQNTIFLQDRFEPNVIVTVFVAEALLHGFRVTGQERFLDGAKSAARFLVDEVPVLYEDANERAIAYVLRPVDAVVLNNNALVGAFLASLAAVTGEDELRSIASKLIRYTVTRRTPYDAWYYTHPREKSPITHDNYHTGGILDALLDYEQATGDTSHHDVYLRGLTFYREKLFDPDGAPRWMHDRRYPRDVHGSAQGIISFSKASVFDPTYLANARTIADWAQDHLFRPMTDDYRYRLGSFFAWDYSLMRWCNGWMSRALGELLIALDTHAKGVKP